MENTSFPVAIAAHLAGTVTLALFFVLLARHDPRPYLRAWTASWIAQALALAALLVSMLRDWTASLSLYLLLETAHGVLLVAAARTYVLGAASRRAYAWLVGPLVLWSGTAPLWLGDSRALEAVQLAVLAATYLAAAVLLGRADRAGMGLRLTRDVLGLLGVAYLLIGALVVWAARSEEHPMALLQASPFGVLFLQMLLGLGMVTAVMEATQQALAASNRQLQDAEHRLRVLAETDPLTGCANRRVFRELVDMVRERRAQGAVLLLDMDGLKTINDRLGHAAGDEAIRGVAEAVRSRTRPDDLVVRWGGDEFVVVLPGVSLADADERRSQITQALGERGLSASIGLAAYGPEQDILASVEGADSQMYAAKSERRRRAAHA